MAKVDRILSTLPSFYRATETHKVLYDIVRQLAQPLEEADTHLFRIQRAHRLRVAEFAEDIVRLAALLNLAPFHFEDILTAEGLPYDQKLALMRRRVQEVAQIHLRGLGTPWAVLQSAAVFLNATIVPEQPGDPLVKHLDAEGFSHRAVIEFRHLPQSPRERLTLHENPFRRQKEPLADRRPPQHWSVDNESMSGPASVKLVIQGVAERTVLPQVYCEETREGLLFNGVVPAGRALVVDEAGGARLDGEPVDRWLVYFKGGAASFAHADDDAFVREESGEDSPFDGSLESLTSGIYQRRKTVPQAPGGRSTWHFTVAEGLYDGHNYDYAVYSLPHLPVALYDEDFQFDNCAFDYEPSAQVGMAWDERVPCAFKLLLPHALQPEQAAGEESSANGDGNALNAVSRIGQIMPRFTASGVRAYVDTAPDAWIVGDSVIRDGAATEGPGLSLHATRLRNPKADMLVAPD